MERKYEVSESDLRYFIECRARLEALEAGGVDNWSWYGESFIDYLNDYFSDNEPEWFNKNDICFDLLVDKEINRYKEVNDNAK